MRLGYPNFMLDDTRPALVALTRAQRARTAVAACDAVRWPDSDEQGPMPFVEQDGSLLLIVTDEQRRQLLGLGGGCVALDAKALGAVRLHGNFWPVADVAARDLVDEIRACHAECLNCPGQRLSQLVGLQVELVELRMPGGDYRHVDLHGYVLARPDRVLALGVQLQEHLNIAHGDEVIEAASALAGQQTGQVLSAQLDWIDGYGFEVSLIDVSGGRQLRCDFPTPVVDPDHLSEAVHQCLARAISSAEEPPMSER